MIKTAIKKSNTSSRLKKLAPTKRPRVPPKPFIRSVGRVIGLCVINL